MINEAFRAQYSLVRMLAQRNKWGLSKKLIWVQDYVFYFYCFDFPVLSVVWLLDLDLLGAIPAVMRTHICIKLIVLTIMTTEALLCHVYGPTRSQAKIEEGQALASGAFRSPLHESRPETEAVGLDEKAKAT